MQIAKKYTIAVVGDFPSEGDEKAGQLFAGATGKMLAQLLADAGILFQDCYVTTVFKTRPAGGDIARWCASKKVVDDEHKILFKSKYTAPAIATGKYLLPNFLPMRLAFIEELKAIAPNIIIGLGSLASWALLDTGKLKQTRGVISLSPYTASKVLITHHPASLFANWSDAPICSADLVKAANESSFPEIRYPDVELWIEPELRDIQEFITTFLIPATYISIDIETNGKDIITCVGFGNGAGKAICVPFVDKRKEGFNYWKTPEEESKAWGLVKAMCQLPAKKILQNALFDIQHLWRHGCPLYNATCDTMIKHHSQQPELEKGLGFLGSVYTNYPSWKYLRTKVKTEKPNG